MVPELHACPVEQVGQMLTGRVQCQVFFTGGTLCLSHGPIALQGHCAYQLTLHVQQATGLVCCGVFAVMYMKLLWQGLLALVSQSRM